MFYLLVIKQLCAEPTGLLGDTQLRNIVYVYPQATRTAFTNSNCAFALCNFYVCSELHKVVCNILLSGLFRTHFDGGQVPEINKAKLWPEDKNHQSYIRTRFPIYGVMEAIL